MVKPNAHQTAATGAGRRKAILILLIAAFTVLLLLQAGLHMRESWSKQQELRGEWQRQAEQKRAQSEEASQQQALASQLLTQNDAIQKGVGAKLKDLTETRSKLIHSQPAHILNSKTIKSAKAEVAAAEEVFKRAEVGLAEIDRRAQKCRPPSNNLASSLQKTRALLTEAFSQSNEFYISLQAIEALRESTALALLFVESDAAAADFEDRILLLQSSGRINADLEKIKKQINAFYGARDTVSKRASGTPIPLKHSSREQWQLFIDQTRADIKSLAEMEASIEAALELAEKSTLKH